MRKPSPAKADKQTMLPAKDRAADNGYDESAEGPCDSPISEVRGLDRLKISKSYPRGSVLFSEGQPARGLYVVCEGRAKVSIGSSNGHTLVLRIAGGGELLGINAAVTGHPYQATAETLERCRIDFIPRDDFLRLLDQDKKATLGIVLALSHTLNKVFDHAKLLFLSQTAREKLARLFVKWCEESGQRTPQGIRIVAAFTHEEIAQMIGASRETVTRLISDFKRKHIIGLLDGAIYVRNRKALESVAGY